MRSAFVKLLALLLSVTHVYCSLVCTECFCTCSFFCISMWRFVVIRYFGAFVAGLLSSGVLSLRFLSYEGTFKNIALFHTGVKNYFGVKFLPYGNIKTVMCSLLKP